MGVATVHRGRVAGGLARRNASGSWIALACAWLASACSAAPAHPSTPASPPLAASRATAVPASPDDSLSTVLRDYSRAAFTGYAETVDSLETLQRAVAELLARPTRESLDRARAAWIACRDPYSRTEAFRFSGGPIDGLDPVRGSSGPEGRINAWPIDEAFLDYVLQQPDAGLISDRRVPIDEPSLVSRNAAADDDQVTLGYHAIEFLLWGQDRSRDGPGARPSTDYLPGDPIRERRRACLALIVELLLRDLRGVRDAWDPAQGAAARRFLATDAKLALGRALSGPATLAAFELASERLGIPLASGEQEDEQSCFSDNTHRDIAADIEGIGRVLEGRGGARGLLAALDAAHAADVRERLAHARRLAARISAPFDQVIVSPPEDPRRRVPEALVGELIGLAGAIQRAGTDAGVHVVIGGG